ncbi:ParA family protein [Streptomyces sp. NPDC056160]|uniref:ParA family protein n=1 Tax=Streptomyces sp. NPDC056160 TaxID=3345731 RepID=UPI0035DFBF81
MSTTETNARREKLLVSLTPEMRRDLRIRAAQVGVDIQDAAAHALALWYDTPDVATVPTKGAKSWGVFLPAGGPLRFEAECEARGLTKVQGMAQAVDNWLKVHPSPRETLVSQPVKRILVALQKGGVGKSFLAAGLAQAFAEMGLRVLLIDYDPQGHMTRRLGVQPLAVDNDNSLLRHMLGQARKHIARILVEIKGDRFGGRLHLLPACTDAFLFDAVMSSVRHGREESLQRALEPIEDDYDVVVIDGPPSLGLAMDIAMHYVHRREGELTERSGIVMPVWADTPSFEAYDLFNGQRKDLMSGTRVEIDELGFVINHFDTRRGASPQRKKEEWEERAAPGVLAVFNDLKEQREATDEHVPLFEYAPHCELTDGLRSLAKELAA